MSSQINQHAEFAAYSHLSIENLMNFISDKNDAINATLNLLNFIRDRVDLTTLNGNVEFELLSSQIDEYVEFPVHQPHSVANLMDIISDKNEAINATLRLLNFVRSHVDLTHLNGNAEFVILNKQLMEALLKLN